MIGAAAVEKAFLGAELKCSGRSCPDCWPLSMGGVMTEEILGCEDHCQSQPIVSL